MSPVTISLTPQVCWCVFILKIQPYVHTDTQVFPKVVQETLPTLNQAFNLASEIGVDSSRAGQLLRNLEVLLEQNKEMKDSGQAHRTGGDIDESPNVSNLFEQLARSTFGPPLTNPQQSVMAKKTKPR